MLLSSFIPNPKKTAQTMRFISPTPRVMTPWELLGSQWKCGVTRAGPNLHPPRCGDGPSALSNPRDRGSTGIHGDPQPWDSSWSTEWLGRTLKTISFQPQHACPIQRLLRNGAAGDPRLEVAVGDSDRVTPPAEPHGPQG